MEEGRPDRREGVWKCTTRGGGCGMKKKEEKGERGRIVVCDFGGARMREFMRRREKKMFFKLYIYIYILKGWVGK
jgi:hypothetical protein